MHNLSLVIFTLCSQLAIGAFIALYVGDCLQKKVSKKTSMITSVILLVITGGAMLASLFHLGQPLGAIRALFNLGVSWLSREILFVALFALFVLIYLVFTKLDKERKIIGAIACVFGLITIASSALIYMIPAMPTWDTSLTMVMFFTTALVGGMTYAVLVAETPKAVKICNIVVPLIALVVSALYLNFLGGLGTTGTSALALINESGLQVVRYVLYVVAALIGVAGLIKENLSKPTFAAVAICLVIIAEVIGRIIFYSISIGL